MDESSAFEQRLLREITSSPDVQGAFSGLSLTDTSTHESFSQHNPYHSSQVPAQYSPHTHYSYARQQAQARKNRPIPKWSERRTGNSKKQWDFDEDGSSEGDHPESDCPENAPPKLRELYERFHFNPRTISMNMNDCRFFVIKSFSEDDVFRSIKHSCWTSTKKGNRNMQIAHEETLSNNGGPLYLFFSVNGSGHFCGIAEMTSSVDMNIETKIWVDDRFKGKFNVRWHYVKDVPNSAFKHIALGNKENKSVTRSRDTQEVPYDGGMQMVQIIHSYPSSTSIFDDFSFYERREMDSSRSRGSSNSSKGPGDRQTDISVTIFNKKSDVIEEEEPDGTFEMERDDNFKRQNMPKIKQKKVSGKQPARADYGQHNGKQSPREDYSRSNGARLNEKSLGSGSRSSYSKPRFNKNDSYNTEGGERYSSSKFTKNSRNTSARKNDFQDSNTAENKSSPHQEKNNNYAKRKYNDEYPSAGANSSVNIQIADQISDDLLQELATAKASGDHKRAGQLRQELWVVQDLARGLPARIEQPETEEAYNRVMFRIAMKSHPVGSGDANESLTAHEPQNKAQNEALCDTTNQNVVTHSADLLAVDPKKEFHKFLVNDGSAALPTEKPKMFKVERSSVLDRASSFLPSIASANSALDEVDPEERSKLDIEHVEGDEQVIEMNLTLVNADDLKESDEDDNEDPPQPSSDVQLTADMNVGSHIRFTSDDVDTSIENQQSAANKLIEELNNNEEQKVNEVT